MKCEIYKFFSTLPEKNYTNNTMNICYCCQLVNLISFSYSNKELAENLITFCTQ